MPGRPQVPIDIPQHVRPSAAGRAVHGAGHNLEGPLDKVEPCAAGHLQELARAEAAAAGGNRLHEGGGSGRVLHLLSVPHRERVGHKLCSQEEVCEDSGHG